MSLIWVTALTAILWMLYTLNVIAVRGLLDTVGYPADPKPLAGWAKDMNAAHAAAVENLVVFTAADTGLCRRLRLSGDDCIAAYLM